MKRPFTKILSLLCALALLLAPAAAIAESEQETIDLNLGSDPKSWFVVPGAGFDTDDMYLNGIPYTPQLNHRNDLIVRTGDLLAAKVIGEIPNVDPKAFQITDGKISLRTPTQDEADPLPPAETETKSDNPFQYVEDRTSDERLSYPEDVIQQYAQALIDGIDGLIKTKEVLADYRDSDGNLSGNPAHDADLPALLEYVTSLLSGDPVTAEAFDNAMCAIHSAFCKLDAVSSNHSGVAGSLLVVNRSALMGTFRTVMEKSGYHLPEYLATIDWKAEPVGGQWRESDYGKLDELTTAREKLKGANGFQLKGIKFELSDGAGNVQPLKVANVWQSPIIKEVDPNEISPIVPDPLSPPVDEEHPDDPGEPDDTDNPENPESPESPDEPETPENPESPDEPEIPESPENP